MNTKHKMDYLPEDSPKKEKVVFFKDEEDVLNLVKTENVTRLNEYIDKNGLSDGLYDRFVGYAINMVRPYSFKTLCLRDMKRVPDDVLKRVFHTTLCDVQDNADEVKLDYLETAANQIYDFLEHYEKLDDADVQDALEIYYDYEDQLDNVLKSVVTKINKKFS